MREVIKTVYDSKNKPSQKILDQPIAQFITETGVYKKMDFRLCDVFNEITIAKERAHENDRAQKKAAKIKDRQMKNKTENLGRLPPGVKMFSEKKFIKDLTEIVEEKKEVQSLTSTKERELMSLIKHTGNKGSNRIGQIKMSRDDFRAQNEAELERILKNDTE